MNMQRQEPLAFNANTAFFVIVGVLVAVLFLALFIALVMFYHQRRRNKQVKTVQNCQTQPVTFQLVSDTLELLLRELESLLSEIEGISHRLVDLSGESDLSIADIETMMETRADLEARCRSYISEVELLTLPYDSLVIENILIGCKNLKKDISVFCSVVSSAGSSSPPIPSNESDDVV